jgi:TPR repeat protein
VNERFFPFDLFRELNYGCKVGLRPNAVLAMRRAIILKCILVRGLAAPPVEYLRSVMSQRDPEERSRRAMVFVGEIYKLGIGVPQDTQEAILWYRQAVSLSGDSQRMYANAAHQALQRLGAE